MRQQTRFEATYAKPDVPEPGVPRRLHLTGRYRDAAEFADLCRSGEATAERKRRAALGRARTQAIWMAGWAASELIPGFGLPGFLFMVGFGAAALCSLVDAWDAEFEARSYRAVLS